jgi:hypothetical protein
LGTGLRRRAGGAARKRRGQQLRQPRPFLSQEVIADNHPSDDLGHVDPDFDFGPEAHI